MLELLYDFSLESTAEVNVKIIIITIIKNGAPIDYLSTPPLYFTPDLTLYFLLLFLSYKQTCLYWGL